MSEGEVVQESATSSSKKYENKYACLCTSCHRRYARKMCVLFRKCNYNFSIKTVGNSLEKCRRCKESGAPEFICKNCHKFFPSNKYKSTIAEVNKCVEQSVNTTLISTTTAIEVQRDFQGQIPLVNSSNLPSDEFMPLIESVLDTVSDCSLTCVPTGSANFIEKEGGNESYLCVCTCCHRTFNRRLCVKFVKVNYDFTNEIVSECLSNDIIYQHTGMDEFICKTCNRQLYRKNNEPIMPYEAVASPQKGLFTCLLCLYKGPRKNSCEFNEQNYNCMNDAVSEAFLKIAENSSVHDKQFICKKCHRKLLGYCFVTCKHCSRDTTLLDAITFDKNRHVEFTAELSRASSSALFICKKCDTQLLHSITCICCKKSIKRNASVLFREHNYDYENSVVQQLLPKANTKSNQGCNQHICKTCHSNIRMKKDRRVPTIPKMLQKKRKLLLLKGF